MANLDELYTTKYDWSCPKCGISGFPITNDGGSLCRCIRCSHTYKSKMVIDSKKITNYCKICGQDRDNHMMKHQYMEF